MGCHFCYQFTKDCNFYLVCKLSPCFGEVSCHVGEAHLTRNQPAPAKGQQDTEDLSPTGFEEQHPDNTCVNEYRSWSFPVNPSDENVASADTLIAALKQKIQVGLA